MLTLSIRLQTTRIVGILATIAVLLLAISVVLPLVRYVGGHDHVYGLLLPAEQLFHVDKESNVPTMFSVFILLCSASLLGLIALLKRQQQDSDLWKWATLTCGFIYLAIDEAWSFHERLDFPMREHLGEGLGIFYNAWVLPAMAVVLILALIFWRFLLRLPSSTRWFFLGAGVSYLGGAIGCEMIEGRYAELYGENHLTFELITVIEESLEMMGIIVFIYALLRYLAEQYPEEVFKISFKMSVK